MSAAATVGVSRVTRDQCRGRCAMWLAAPKKSETALEIARGGGVFLKNGRAGLDGSLTPMEDGSRGGRSELGRGWEGGRRGQQRNAGKNNTIIL